MTVDLVKEQEYETVINSRDGTKVKITRRNGTALCIEAAYQAVYGLGEKFDAVNQKGKTVENQVIEKFCNQGKYSYCTTPFL